MSARSSFCALPLALLLLGCSPDPSGEAPASDASSARQPVATADPVPVYLEHVRVGQRYAFHMNQSGSEMDMVWTVKAIEPARIRYAVSVLKNGVAVSPPSETAWTIPAPPAPPAEDQAPAEPDPGVQVSREALTLAGRTWTCQVTTTGDVKTWVPMHGERPSFPPLLKQTKGALVSTVLTKIEAP